MAVVETNLGSKKSFQSGSLIMRGETFLDTNKATLKTLDGKNFTVPESDEATVAAYNEIFAAYTAWVTAQLP